jgi:hypothetical protein
MNFSAALEDDQDQAALVAAPALDMDVIRPKFEDYKAEAIRIVTEANALTVHDDDSLNIAVMLGGNAKKIGKVIDAKRKGIIAEPQDFVKSVNGLCKMIMDNLDEAERVAKQKIGQYQAKIELERRKQEEAARKAADELQAKLLAEAKEANRKIMEDVVRKAEEAAKARGEVNQVEIEAARKKAEEEAAKHEIQAPTVLAPVFQEAPKVTRTDTGTSAYQRKAWTFEVMDASLVPAEYKIVDEQLIKDAVKMGAREIPGVRIFEETKTVFRT